MQDRRARPRIASPERLCSPGADFVAALAAEEILQNRRTLRPLYMSDKLALSDIPKYAPDHGEKSTSIVRERARAARK